MSDCFKRNALIVGDCKYCKKSFCLKHRLPECHSCQNLQACKDAHFEKNKNALIQ